MSDLFDSGLLDVKFDEVQGTAYENFPVSPLLIVPQQYTPAIDFNFAATKALDSRITFTRASVGTYVDSTGLVQTASAGMARFTHDPSTLQSLGLIIEGAKTNLFSYTEQIDNAAWTKIGSSASADQIASPSGVVNADLLTENSVASTQHRIAQFPTVSIATDYTVSCFVKRGSGSRQFGLGITTVGPNARVYFDLDAGTVANAAAGSGTIKAYPNGWFLCTATGTTSGTSASVYLQMCSGTTTGAETYSGDGTSGLYIWGAQLEASSFATSYIPNTSGAASADRAADVATMTGTNFSSWYNQSEGTIATNVVAANAATATILTIDDNSLNNRIYLQRESASSTARGVVAVSGSNQASIAVTGVSTSLIAALSYKANKFDFAAAGTAGTPDTSGTIPTVDRMRIGNTSVSGYELNGTVSRIRYFNRALANSVQALST